MVFSSLLFLFRFLPAVLLVYYLMPQAWRNFVLLLFSLAFYAWGEPVYIGLMIVSILISYTGGILVDRFEREGKRKAAKATMAISCAAGLSLLHLFKYADFALELINYLTGRTSPCCRLCCQSGFPFIPFRQCPISSTCIGERLRYREISYLSGFMWRCFRS